MGLVAATPLTTVLAAIVVAGRAGPEVSDPTEPAVLADRVEAPAPDATQATPDWDDFAPREQPDF